MTFVRGLRLAVAATLTVIGLWAALSAPGFLSDRDSTVPVRESAR